MRIWIFVGALVAAVSATSYERLIHKEWEVYKDTYEQSFSNDEDEHRMAIFVENRLKIAQHNERYVRGEVGFALAVNRLSHLTTKEINDVMNRFDETAKNASFAEPPSAKDSKFPQFAYISENADFPEEVDWRDDGAVTPVKNQGNCGSCYAFSATGALEGQIFIKTGNLISLSEQNIMDCSERYGNHGCGGGNAGRVFRYIKDNDGVDTEYSYPYTATNGNCHYNGNAKGATISGMVYIQRDEATLQDAVANIGPISVAIDASHNSFHAYDSGVYYEPECSDLHLNHEVLVVGYGTDDEEGDYWLVKNSWGEDWGDDGYIRMARDRDNNCGIASRALYPLI